MISWGVIGYGAALSALLAGLLVAAATRTRRRATVGLAAALAAAAGPIAWNAILRATHADQFFHDAPTVVLPASCAGIPSAAVFSGRRGDELVGDPLGDVPSLRTPDSPPSPETPAGFRVISGARTGITAAYAGSSASPPSARYAPAPPPGAYCDRKCAEGKTHRQAAAALSRRRVDVLWACIRDNQPYQPKRSRSDQLAAV